MEDVQRRRLIRETMLAGKDIPEETRLKLCSLTDFMEKKKAKCQVIYTFVVGGNPHASPRWDSQSGIPRTIDASAMLKHEKDILYLNIRESMNDGKTESWFAYAAEELQGIDYVAKADSDSLISIPQLLSHINGFLPPSDLHPKIYGGYLNEYEACGGAGELCDKLRGKVYMSGQFYFLSIDLARYISSQKVREQPFITTHNEDSDLGFRVLSYPEPISLFTCNGAKFWVHPLKSENEWTDEYRKMADDWFGVSTSSWIGGLHEKAAVEKTVRSVLGKIVNSVKVPVFLD
jgi:hypothetical protein